MLSYCCGWKILNSGSLVTVFGILALPLNISYLLHSVVVLFQAKGINEWGHLFSTCFLLCHPRLFIAFGHVESHHITIWCVILSFRSCNPLNRHYTWIFVVVPKKIDSLLAVMHLLANHFAIATSHFLPILVPFIIIHYRSVYLSVSQNNNDIFLVPMFLCFATVYFLPSVSS